MQKYTTTPYCTHGIVPKKRSISSISACNSTVKGLRLNNIQIWATGSTLASHSMVTATFVSDLINIRHDVSLIMFLTMISIWKISSWIELERIITGGSYSVTRLSFVGLKKAKILYPLFLLQAVTDNVMKKSFQYETLDALNQWYSNTRLTKFLPQVSIRVLLS